MATSKGENRNPDCPEAHYRSMDITDPSDIQSVFEFFQPDAVINTAAMTNVDACEADEENCRKINVDAVSYLYEACANFEAHFTYLSTDFVFDGEAGPYSEEDKRNPLSIYAQSKVDFGRCFDKW